MIKNVIYNISKTSKFILGILILINFSIFGCANVSQQRIFNFYIFIDISGSYKNYFEGMKEDINGLEVKNLCKNLKTNIIVNFHVYFFGDSIIPYKKNYSMIINIPMRKIDRDSCEQKYRNFKTNLINYLDKIKKYDDLTNISQIFTLISKKQLNNNFAENSKTIVVIYSDFLNTKNRKFSFNNLKFNKNTYFYFIIPPLEKFQDSTLSKNYCLNYIKRQMEKKHIDYSLKSLDDSQSIFQEILKFQINSH